MNVSVFKCGTKPVFVVFLRVQKQLRVHKEIWSVLAPLCCKLNSFKVYYNAGLGDQSCFDPPSNMDY